MESFRLILCFVFGFAVAYAQNPADGGKKLITQAQQDAQAQLQLRTSIIDQRYAVEPDSLWLYMTLNLTYTNTGNRPLLLDKKSSLISRRQVSSNLKAAAAKKYEYVSTSSFITIDSLLASGMLIDAAPEKEAFITLQPGETYSPKKEIALRLYDGTEDSEDALRPGSHYLQVRVATWFYFADLEMYRQQWRDAGYLWSKDVTSEPMRFTIEKRW